LSDFRSAPHAAISTHATMSDANALFIPQQDEIVTPRIRNGG
jgi:hypothetical protein